MRIASLDLGSNTFLMLIADFQDGKFQSVVRDELTTTRLGQGVHANRKFHPEALERADECFSRYAKIIEEVKPDKVIAMATSAARDVSNGEDLFKLGEKYGIPIRIIPGEKEAQISFEGSTFEHKEDKGLAVIDVGGGSTEVIAKDSTGKLVGKSLDIGSVRLTELFGEDIEKLEDYCDKIISECRDELIQEPIKKLVAVAGTPVTISLIIQESDYIHEKVHGYEFSLEQLRELRSKLAEMPLEKRKAIKGMDPKRADVIVAGTTILLKTAQALAAENILVSNHGVRYGIAHLAARGEC